MHKPCGVLTLLASGLALSLVGRSPTQAAEIDFSRDIRPILSNACFLCHGPDEKNRKGELRLDLKEAAFAKHGDHFAIVPGQADASELVKRITSTDPDVQMPPPDSGKKVTAEQIAMLKNWIAQGATWTGHWAFTAPTRPATPVVNNQAWARNPIDAFVLARLEREALPPSPEADKVTLLRRLSLDLVGLPPTSAEVAAFVADTAPEAYQKQVERLLASPHYGERWGRLWLDAARYADSDGYEKDKSRQVWFYRDWVIAAHNRDLPYDQFIIEQLAGDLLPEPTQDQRVATGFLRNSMINEEGGIDPEQFRMEAMFDRMDAIGKSVLGVTIQCAQCHNHKYDPLTQLDYYRMFAFLNNDSESNVAVYTPDEQLRRAEILRRTAELENELRHNTPDWSTQMAAWEASVRGNQPNWVVVRPSVDDISTGGQKYLPLDDGSILAAGYAPTKHKVKLIARVDTPSITAIRLELLNDPDLPLSGPGRSPKGTGALTQFDVEAAPADAPEKVSKVAFASASADVNPAETPLDAMFDDKSNKKRVTGPIGFAIDGKDETAWGFDIGPGRSNQPRKAVFATAAPISNSAGTILTFYLQQNHGGWNSDDNQNCNLGRFRLSVTSAPGATADPLPARVRAIFAIPSERRTSAELAAIFSYWRTTKPEWQAVNEQIEAIWRTHPTGDAQLVLAARSQPRVTRMLTRGDFLKPADPVTPGVPGFLHPLPSNAPPTRLTFARWLVDRKSPTTARTLVNRSWQTFFGTGLVASSEDLGSQSESPSHRELLDWLAVELMDRGWSLKNLQRLIVNSATYRQSSRVSPELAARDPQNRLLARGARFRVDAELVRDVALAASGLLNRQLGGPSVHPPAPDFLFQPPTSYGPKTWREEGGDQRYRRALYTFRYRSVPYPALQTFDAPNGDFSCVRRPRSNTPLQALVTLNEPLFVDCARALGALTLKDGGADDAARINYLFERCVSRRPTERETKILADLLHRESARFDKGELNPAELLSSGPTAAPQPPAGATNAQLAAWMTVARVVLNLDETITKE